MNPVYTGDMVWNRKAKGKFHSIGSGRAQERKGLVTRKERWNAKVDWEVAPNAHPALIDRRAFDEAQRLRKERALSRGGIPYRSGRAKKSPYLLPSLIFCTRCGHRFHGYTINSTIRRKDGSKIKTQYYACGGAVSKGVCKRVLIRKNELENDIVGRIRGHVESFLSADGDKILRRILADGLNVERQRPKVERRVLRKRLDAIDQTIDRLLENLTPINKEFVDKKLIGLKRDRDGVDEELGRLTTLPHDSVDVDALADQIIAGMDKFEEIFQEGTLEEKKEFISLFVERIELDTKENRGKVFLRKFPAPASLGTGKSSFEMAPHDCHSLHRSRGAVVASLPHLQGIHEPTGSPAVGQLTRGTGENLCVAPCRSQAIP